jgi:hypothetical protein
MLVPSTGSRSIRRWRCRGAPAASRRGSMQTCRSRYAHFSCERAHPLMRLHVSVCFTGAGGGHACHGAGDVAHRGWPRARALCARGACGVRLVLRFAISLSSTFSHSHAHTHARSELGLTEEEQLQLAMQLSSEQAEKEARGRQRDTEADEVCMSCLCGCLDTNTHTQTHTHTQTLPDGGVGDGDVKHHGCVAADDV